MLGGSRAKYKKWLYYFINHKRESLYFRYSVLVHNSKNSLFYFMISLEQINSNIIIYIIVMVFIKLSDTSRYRTGNDYDKALETVTVFMDKISEVSTK